MDDSQSGPDRPVEVDRPGGSETERRLRRQLQKIIDAFQKRETVWKEAEQTQASLKRQLDAAMDIVKPLRERLQATQAELGQQKRREAQQEQRDRSRDVLIRQLESRIRDADDAEKKRVAESTTIDGASAKDLKRRLVESERLARSYESDLVVGQRLIATLREKNTALQSALSRATAATAASSSSAHATESALEARISQLEDDLRSERSRAKRLAHDRDVAQRALDAARDQVASLQVSQYATGSSSSSSSGGGGGGGGGGGLTALSQASPSSSVLSSTVSPNSTIAHTSTTRIPTKVCLELITSSESESESEENGRSGSESVSESRDKQHDATHLVKPVVVKAQPTASQQWKRLRADVSSKRLVDSSDDDEISPVSKSTVKLVPRRKRQRTIPAATTTSTTTATATVDAPFAIFDDDDDDNNNSNNSRQDTPTATRCRVDAAEHDLDLSSSSADEESELSDSGCFLRWPHTDTTITATVSTTTTATATTTAALSEVNCSGDDEREAEGEEGIVFSEGDWAFPWPAVRETIRFMASSQRHPELSVPFEASGLDDTSKSLLDSPPWWVLTPASAILARVVVPSSQTDCVEGLWRTRVPSTNDPLMFTRVLIHHLGLDSSASLTHIYRLASFTRALFPSDVLLRHSTSAIAMLLLGSEPTQSALMRRLCQFHACLARLTRSLQAAHALFHRLVMGSRSGLAPLMASYAYVWPRAVRANTSGFVATVQRVVLQQVACEDDTEESEESLALLERRCAWPVSAVQLKDDDSAVVSALVESLSCGVRVRSACRALDMLGVHFGADFACRVLLQDHVWPRVKDCVAKWLAGDDENDGGGVGSADDDDDNATREEIKCAVALMMLAGDLVFHARPTSHSATAVIVHEWATLVRTALTGLLRCAEQHRIPLSVRTTVCDVLVKLSAGDPAHLAPARLWFDAQTTATRENCRLAVLL